MVIKKRQKNLRMKGEVGSLAFTYYLSKTQPHCLCSFVRSFKFILTSHEISLLSCLSSESTMQNEHFRVYLCPIQLTFLLHACFNPLGFASKPFVYLYSEQNHSKSISNINLHKTVTIQEPLYCHVAIYRLKCQSLLT